jgi:hypothetical protein
VLERGTRDAISGATVILGEGEEVREAFTDQQGAFSFADVPVGPAAAPRSRRAPRRSPCR